MKKFKKKKNREKSKIKFTLFKSEQLEMYLGMIYKNYPFTTLT